MFSIEKAHIFDPHSETPRPRYRRSLFSTSWARRPDRWCRPQHRHFDVRDQFQRRVKIDMTPKSQGGTMMHTEQAPQRQHCQIVHRLALLPDPTAAPSVRLGFQR
jgi:hypothetical protein